ncbi:MAG: DUF2029 domain-containing protein [Chloroflexota bacterium]|nr:DUF2029 domain-containing protein [Chloroflexota bacterium]
MAHPSAPAPLRLRPGFLTRLGFGLGIGLLIAYAALVVIQVKRPSYVLRTDFIGDLTGVMLLAEGRPAVMYDEAAQTATQTALLQADGLRLTQLLHFNHLPYESLLLLPLHTLGWGFGALLAAWSLLNAAAVVAGLALLAWAWPVRAPARRGLILAGLTFFPLTTAFLLGQNSGLVFLGWAGGSAALRRGYPGWAGAAFALATLKPQAMPLLLLALLCDRAWRVLGTYSAVGLVSVLITMPLLGVDWPLHYIGYLLRYATVPPSGSIDPVTLQNLVGFADRLLGTGPPATALAAGLTLLALVVFGLLCRRTRRAGGVPGTAAWDGYWVAILALALLVSPHVQRHDLTLALVPGWILAAQALAAGRARRLAWLGLGWLAGLIAGVVPSLVLSPAVLWLACTAGWLLWSLGNSNTSPTQIVAANVDNTLVNPL